MTDDKCTILFVCTGNTCRSPMAEGLMQHLIEEEGLSEQFEIQSAGVAAYAGSPASIETKQILLDYGINFDAFRSSKISQYHLESSDYIFCLSNMHRQAILQHFPEISEKVLLVGEFLGSETPQDVADPYGLGADAYKHVEEQLSVAVGNILSFVQQSSEDEQALAGE